MSNAVMNALRLSRGTSGSINPAGSVLALRSGSNYQKVTNIGTGVTRTSYTFGGKPKTNNFTKNGQRYIQTYQNVGSVLIAKAGYSGVGESLQSGNSPELLGILNNMYTGSGSVTSEASSSMIGMSGYDTDFFLQSIKRSVYFTSSSSVNQTLRIYECVAKLDTQDVDVSKPTSAWRNGLVNQFGDAFVPDTDGTGTLNNLALYPSMTRSFRTWWHVEKYYDIELPAGATHIHTSDYYINSVLPYQRVANTVVMGGVVRQLLYVLTSSPVHGSNVLSVGFGSTSTDVVEHRSYTIYGKVGSNTVYYSNTALPNFGTGEAQVGDVDMQERITTP